MSLSTVCTVLVVISALPFYVEGIIGTDCTVSEDVCDIYTEDCVADVCTCRIGYIVHSMYPTLCTDEDECSSGTHWCDTDAVCTNTVGSFECSCNPGFIGNGYHCYDENECSSVTHECHTNAVCTNTVGSFECTCNPGFIDYGLGYNCSDEDECSSVTHWCPTNAVCTNTAGSFYCTCNPGFIDYGLGYNCSDLDECSTGDDNCYYNNAGCTNTFGSFYCTYPGYICDGVTACKDEDECSSGTHWCPTNAVCTNTVGSFECTCNPGFHEFGSNGRNCSDLDECRYGRDNCAQNCTNTNGSFYCTCLLGYTGDGVTCADIDECQIETHNCPTNAKCYNSESSYDCSCNRGYTGDGVTCIDADECSDGTYTGCAYACSNTIGSYDCTCYPGYTGNGRTCTDIDECSMGTHNCGEVCTNIGGSFQCTCFSENTGTCTVGISQNLNIICHHCEPNVVLDNEVKVVEGQNLHISCADNSTSSVDSAMLSWSGTLASSSDSLQLDSVSRSHSGNITCAKDNGQQDSIMDYDTKTVFLNVLYEPKVHILTDRRVVIGNNASVTCITSPGNPNTTSYRWTRSQDDWSRIANVMTLHDVVLGDTGKYTCTAENIMDPTGKGLIRGVDSRELSITVIESEMLSGTGENTPTGIIIGVSVGIVVVIAVLIVFIFIIRRYRGTGRTDNDVGKPPNSISSNGANNVAVISNQEAVYDYIFDNMASESDQEPETYASIDEINVTSHTYLDLASSIDQSKYTYLEPAPSIDQSKYIDLEPVPNRDQSKYTYLEPVPNRDNSKHTYLELDQNRDQSKYTYLEPAPKRDINNHTYLDLQAPCVDMNTHPHVDMQATDADNAESTYL